MAINRTPFNALVDDDGSNTVGSLWNKSAIDTVILTPADVELALKAPLASPALTGTPTAPTPAAGNSSTLLATTAFATGAIATATVPPVWVPVAYSASNFFGTGTMNWTVDAGDQIRFSYLVNGKTLTLSFYLDATTLSGTANSEVRIILPGGYTVKGWCSGFCWIYTGAAGVPGLIRGLTGLNYVSLFRADFANHVLGTNNIVFSGTFSFEIN